MAREEVTNPITTIPKPIEVAVSSNKVVARPNSSGDGHISTMHDRSPRVARGMEIV
jgi:hypothetical protein